MIQRYICWTAPLVNDEYLDEKGPLCRCFRQPRVPLLHMRTQFSHQLGADERFGVVGQAPLRFSRKFATK